jgi:hypothetical protein
VGAGFPGDSDADQYRYRDEYANPYTDWYSDPYAHSYPHGYAYRNLYADGNVYGNGDADIDLHANLDTYADPDADTLAYHRTTDNAINTNLCMGSASCRQRWGSIIVLVCSTRA